MFSVLVIRLRSLRLLRVSGIVMRLRMFLLLITFLKASHSFRNRLLVICKNAYLFATMIMTSFSIRFIFCIGMFSLILCCRFFEIASHLPFQPCFVVKGLVLSYNAEAVKILIFAAEGLT